MRISRLLLVVALSAMLASCGPLGPVPGGELNGELASDRPGDWSFSNAHKTIQLEVRPSDPYSVNLWCVASNGNLYVGAGQGASSAWARALLEDGRARVRIDTTLYAVVAPRVTAPDEIQTYLEALSAKFESSQANPADFRSDAGAPAAAILFRLDPAPENGAAAGSGCSHELPDEQ
jgi:hypothetical protein